MGEYSFEELVAFASLNDLLARDKFAEYNSMKAQGRTPEELKAVLDEVNKFVDMKKFAEEEALKSGKYQELAVVYEDKKIRENNTADVILR